MPVIDPTASTSMSAIAAKVPTLVSSVHQIPITKPVVQKAIHHPIPVDLGTDKVPPPLPTPINVPSLVKALHVHPNQEFVSDLRNNLTNGARIGFTGSRTKRFAKNLPTAFEHPEIVSENLANEVRLGRTAGPFDIPPFKNFQVSPIGLVPKKHSNKYRTIFHLSFPKSGDSSINYSIPKEEFGLHYITIDNAIEGIISFGQGCFLAKTDIESAFRLIPVHPDDYELLGMFWDDKYFYDRVLPFGLRSAPFLFNQLSEAIEWILIHKCFISFVCHILDDFLLIEPPSPSAPFDQTCRASLSSMLLTFQNLNIPVAPKKTEGPCTVIEFMGIVLDSNRMEARLPRDKVERILEALASFEKKRSCTLKELQSLIGTLNFACKVVPPGRPFLQRMIELTRNLTKSHHHVKLNAGFFKDVLMWKQFISTWNGANFFLPSSWQNTDSLHLHTDASGTLGYGGIFGSRWFQGAWEPSQELGQPGISIAWQEFYAIVVAVELWATLFSNRKIVFFCDNESVVGIINTKKSRIPRIMDLLRHFTLLTLHNNIYVRAQHIAGKRNTIADSISRFQMDKFRSLAPLADKFPTAIPKSLLEL